MARIPEIPSVEPSFSTLQNPLIPQGNESISRISNPGVVGQALARAGESGMEISNEWAQRQNMIAAAQARSNLLVTAAKATREAQLIPDPDLAKKYYDNAVNQASEASRKAIPGLFASKEFQAQVGSDLEWSNKVMDEQIIVKRKQANIAAIAQHTDDLIDTFSRTADDGLRSRLMENYHSYLTTMRDSGVITPEQFESAAKETAQKASVAYYSLHPDQIAPDLQKKLGTTSSTGSNPYNMGNVKTAEGAAAGTQQFQQPATPTDGVILAANTLRRNYQGMTLQQIGEKWTGESSDKANAWVNNVSSTSGIVPSQVPNLNDPQQLKSLLSGIATAEKSPQDRKNFTDDVLSNGTQAALGGQQPRLGQPTENKTGKPMDFIPTYEAQLIAKEAQARSEITARLQDQQQKAQQGQLMNDYLTRMLKGESVVKDITNDKLLSFEQREHVLTAASNLAKNGSRTDDQLFTRLFQNIHAADNDPDKITDPQALVPYVGQGLSFEDYGRLSKEIQGNATPEGKAEGEMKKTLLNAAQKQLVLMPQDQEGEQKFGAFQAWFLPAYDKARSSGKTADQLLNPDSPDYMGKAITAFDRPQAQRIADRLKDPMQFTPPQRSAEDVRTDYRNGKISRDEALNELKGFGYK